MYRHSQRSLQICSRCLSRKPLQLRLFPSTPIVVYQRSHSSASSPQEAIHRDHNDDDKQHDTSYRDHKNQSALRYRHFRPYESTELGLESLGKPAEVIILPSRERRLPETPAHTDDEERTSVHDLYHNDSVPLSWEEIQNNLLAVRDSVLPQNSPNFIDPAKWNELARIVSKGFTREQLTKYLNENVGSTSDSQAGLEIMDKRALTTHIMTRVWKLEIATPENQDQISAVETKIDKIKDETAYLKVNKYALDLALGGDGQMLRDISEQFKVQIDVFRDKSKVSVTGKGATVRGAKTKLRQKLTKVPFSRTVELSDSLRALALTSSFDRYLRSLMQKHSTRIVRKTDNFTIYASEEASLDLAQQDLTQMIHSEHRNAGYNFLGNSDRSQFTKVRFYPSTLPSWLQQQQTWYRWRRKDGVGQLIQPSPKDDTKSLTSKVRQDLAHRKLASIQEVQQLFLSQPHSLRTDFVANLGQALFNSDRAIATELQSAFTSNIPLLPQAFSSKEVSLDIKSREKYLLLRLRPRDENTKLPSFEVYIQGEKIDSGLQQAVSMAKVHIKLGSAIHDVLLPSEQVDIRLTQSTLLEIFDSTSEPPLPRHSPFLKSIAALVKTMQVQEPGSPTTVYYLDLMPLFNEPPKLASLASKQEGNSPGLSSEVTHLLSTIKKQKTKPFEAAYFVEPLEWLDRVVYTHRSRPEINVEHTISAPLSDEGSSVSRQSVAVLSSVHSTRKSSTSSTEHENPDPGSVGDVTSGDDQLGPVLEVAIDLAQKLTACSKATNGADNV